MIPAKTAEERILDAAFAAACEVGVGSINARTVSEKPHCSTQPVMYHFAAMENGFAYLAVGNRNAML